MATWEVTDIISASVTKQSELLFRKALAEFSTESEFIALLKSNRLETVRKSNGEEQLYLDGRLILTLFPYEIVTRQVGTTYTTQITQRYRVHYPRQIKESPDTITDTEA